jgi:hypothetical protein
MMVFPKRPKTAQNGPKRPKTAQNGPKTSSAKALRPYRSLLYTVFPALKLQENKVEHYCHIEFNTFSFSKDLGLVK